MGAGRVPIRVRVYRESRQGADKGNWIARDRQGAD